MNNVTITEAEAQSGISHFRIWRLCKTGIIKGAELRGKTYLLPEDWQSQIEVPGTLSVSDAAKSAGVSKSAINAAIADGRIISVPDPQRPKRRLVRVWSLEKYKEGKQNV